MDEIPNLHLKTPAVTLEQRYEGTNVSEDDIARQNAFESGVRPRLGCTDSRVGATALGIPLGCVARVS